jgi:hypothetical protein
MADAVRSYNPDAPNSLLSAWNNQVVLSAIRELIRSTTLEPYNLYLIRTQLKYVLTAQAAAGGPRLVSGVYYNDPRTWADPTIDPAELDPMNDADWDGNGSDSLVRFATGANGVFQVNLVPPVQQAVATPTSAPLYVPIDSAALGDSLQKFTDALNTLDNSGELSQSLSFVGLKLGEDLSAPDVLQEFADQLSAYLETHPSATTTDVVGAIQNFTASIDGLTISVEPSSVTGDCIRPIRNEKFASTLC